MKNRVKRMINFRIDHYRELEIKLEKLAEKGLFLEACGVFLWTFRKGEPKKIKYTVTYFSEGSLFNPSITDNQQTYFEYAKAAGWDFVTQYNQVQIFSNEAENPVPFETDEREKFENIRKSMKKSILPSMILLLAVFLLNLVVQFNSFKLNPIDFLADTSRLFSGVMIFIVLIYECYSLIDYFVWCKRSERSIASGGSCIENTGVLHRIVDAVFLCCIFGCLGWGLFYLASEGNWFSLIIGMAQVPILLSLFFLSIKYLKKKKATAMMNRVISFTVLIIATLAYLAAIMVLIIKFDFPTGNESDYRIVTWKLTPMESHDYKLYSDELPLTCEDLYGQIDYDYYSYEKTKDSTIFLKRNSYRQDSLPAKDAPPELAYEVLEPRFGFVYDLLEEHLLTIPEWRKESSFRPIDNDIFGTAGAYQEYYGDSPMGEYVLFFDGKIVTLDIEEPPAPEQIMIIKEKLKL